MGKSPTHFLKPLGGDQVGPPCSTPIVNYNVREKIRQPGPQSLLCRKEQPHERALLVSSPHLDYPTNTGKVFFQLLFLALAKKQT